MGGKKSGGAATPSYEAPNTLNSAQSLRIVDAVCEGEIRGFANGNDAPWKSVFLNDTPVQNADGSFNFKGLAGFFLRGTPDQPYIPGFDVSERTVAVSVEVKKSTPIVRAVTDKLVGRLRVTLGVDRNFQVQGNGDTLAAHTVLQVELVNKDGVRAVESVTFSERAGGVYYQDVLFDQLPEAPFNIRVSRLTDDAASDKTGNKTYFASFVEMIDAKLTYPHTVLAALSVDSDQFGNSVPRRNYLLDGMLVNVPSNYNPDTREYAGSVWDGSFKKAWTNNPAWVFYDVLTQPRYSTLARRLKAADIDKWTLYQVAKYCDELVDDGFGGKEPRFVCNAYLSEKRQAAELLTDLASVFRGLPVWDGRRFSVVMDADADAVAQYANSNVKDGLFTYSGAAFKSISTAVMVQYVDKYDGYRTKTEYVQDDEAVRRYGLNVRQVAAFGCDSRGQAARFGAWMLQTGLRQQDAVSFTVGREGLRHLPYDVVRIMDNDYAGADFSGRLKAVSGLTVTLDRPVEAEIGSRFSVESDGVLQTLEVMAKPAADRLELSAAPQAAVGDVWVLQGRVKARLYRVVSSKENTADGTFTVSALRHDPQKYGVVDGWAKFDREITTLHNTVPQLMNPSLTAGGGRLTITWDNLTADGQVLTYDVKIYRDNVLYRHIPDAQTAEIVLENLPNGNYRAEIRGRNARGVLSEPLVKAWSLDYTIMGLKAAPRLQAIQLDWTLPQTVVNDVQTEIWYAESNNRDAAKKLTTLPYPQNSYTLSGVAVSDRYWFWLRLVDAAGNSGEWTAAVAGRSDPSPAPIVAQLRGAIEKSSLSQALIDSLDADAASKVAAEAQARVAAIQAASKKAADDLAAKARELGTKITVVENVNTEQARQIQAVTAAQGNTAAGLEAEKRARAEGDRAEAQARETLVGRVASAEGSINTLRETVVRNDGARAEEIRQLQAKFTIPDTRNDNRPPSWYYANHPRSTVSEFKQADVLGLGGGFAALETVVPWGDPTGGRIFQTAYLQDGTVMRRKSDTVYAYAGGVLNYTKDLWTEWAADETADGAQAKADAVRRVAEAAQAAANRVDADFRQFASTQAGKDGATAQRISELSASIGNLQIGGRNFIRDSAITVQNANYLIQTYTLSDNMLQEGEPVVVTIWGDLGSDREAFWPFNSNGWNWLGVMKKVSDGVYRIVTTWKRSKNNPSNDRLLIYCGPNTGKTVSRIDRIKLERGTVGTDWSPAPEDEAARREAALTQYQQAQAQKDAALSEEQKTLKAELSGQKARVEQSASALATLDGKVRSMYGLKVETVSGGRKVIAGLALGADGQTGDSQMLVYADKFAIVDPKSKILKSPFVVQTAGGKTQMALSGDFVADGLIHGRHIAAGQTLSSPSIEGGSLNIGGGQFTVSSDGSLVAQNAVVRGRIEGESGYFNGTIKASRIEGDVMKVVRMKKLANTVWEALIQAEALPMMVRPDFEVRTVNPDHARRNQATAEFLVDGKRQPVSRSFETRVTSVMKDEKYNTIGVKTDYTATTSYGWYVLPRNKSVLLQLQLAENETPTTPIPCLQTAYLSPSDAEYKTLIGKMVWRRLTDYVRLKVGWLDKGMWKAVYGLPDDIYGLRLKYLTDNNPEWANGIVWMQDGTATAIKANSTANHAAAPRQYTREVNQASSSNAVILSARNDWQWMELRDVEVLVPEDRVF
nr:phage tail protein [Neisseria elongata]